MDLSKAFDSLSHDILLNKLTYYGVKNSANDLLRSYLSNRKQYVQIDDISSSIVSINTGVPQGSILGPLLFNICINDIIMSSDSGSSTTFCSKRLMNQLKLQGSKTTYELQTLHGSKKQCTEVVSLHMSSTDGLKCLDMNNVVVVDNIPVERSHLPDVSNYPHLKDLTFSEATQVDILIGQDNSAALIPLDVRRGHVKAPFAILTMMGWSLNGCAPVSVPSHRVTSYVTSAIILDEGVHQQCEDGETGVAQGTLDVSNYQQAFILDDESLPHSPGKKPVSVMLTIRS